MLLVVPLAVAAFAFGRKDQPRPMPPVAPMPTSTAARRQAPKLRPLDVQVDRSGRPYDVAMPAGYHVTTSMLTHLTAPSNRVLVGGGESIAFGGDGETPITLAPRADHRYRIDVVWRQSGAAHVRDVAGVIIRERAGAVTDWRAFEPASYGTDAGTGGITTPEWTPRVPADEGSNQLFQWLDGSVSSPGDDDLTVMDLDGVPGNDTIVFANGWGDGGFPGIAGYDRAGRRVAILIWNVIVPWRLAGLEGTPPIEVTRRERVLARCLAGQVSVPGASGCRRIDGP